MHGTYQINIKHIPAPAELGLKEKTTVNGEGEPEGGDITVPSPLFVGYLPQRSPLLAVSPPNTQIGTPFVADCQGNTR